MKKLASFFAIFLILVMVFSFIPVNTTYAWDVDEVYEHNQRVRTQWVDREMCDNLRKAYTLPAMTIVNFYLKSEFPDKITYTANSIIDGIYSDFEKARAIANWVSRNISFGLDYVVMLPGTRHHTDALNVLQTRTSVCTGFSNLTVALLRSVDIPAKRVNGLTTNSGDDGGHAWIEAYVDDRWIIIDPTWMTGYRGSFYFDTSLREFSRSHRYEERFILVLHGINGLVFDSRSNHFIGFSMDTSTITEFIVPESVTVLNSVANFLEYEPCIFPNLERLILPEGLVNISGHMFGRSGLYDVVLPLSLEIIGNFAFQETNLAEISLPNNLERIGSYAFENTNLSNVVLPENLSSLGISAFANTNLGSIVIPESLERINAGTFYNANLHSVFISSYTRTIIDGAFDSNPYLTVFGYTGSAAERYANDAGIPFVAVSSVEIVDDFAMDGSTLLFPMFDREDITELVIPEAVTEITQNAFRNFVSLTDFSISDGIVSIGSGAFAGCTSLDAVFIPPYVAYIGFGAFDTGVVIYGHYGSVAEEFAIENGNLFISATALGEPIVEAADDVDAEAVSEIAENEQDFGMFFVIGGAGVLVVGVVVLIVVKSRGRV